ncbi:MAG: SPL family radical SAM protein [Desulfomonilaceae bacterium]
MKYPISQVWIAQDVANEPLTHRILEKLDHEQVKVIQGVEVDEAIKRLLLESDPLRQGKKIIRLIRYKGHAIRPCPGTRSYVCCNLQILHLGQGCPMDCRYCALQAYLNSPVLDVFANRDDLFADMEDYLARRSDRFHRICTGEFTDSLALDPLTDLAGDLVAFFSTTKNATLELKTKTDHIGGLLDVDPKGRVIVSFSVNAEHVVRKEELGSSSLSNRLAAARQLDQRGYKLGFHFDPIIPDPDWKRSYLRTIQEIAACVNPRNIVWISLGVLRFVPELKDVVLARFGALPYFHDAFIRGLDGKFRLYVDRRIHIYKTLFRFIRSHLPEARVYLCMESPHIWQQALGVQMPTSEALAEYLDAAVR